MKPSIAIVPLLAVIGLSGCYEPVGVTVYEAGTYKGAHGPRPF